MKLKRICALALCSALCAGALCISTGAEENATKTYDGSLTLDKTATKNADGSYTISLEAALKQSACDIVLVVDQSGAMGAAYAQDEGDWEYTESKWETGLSVNGLPIGNHPPFGTGTWSDDGDYYMQDPYDKTVYHKLERSSHTYPFYEGYWWVKYSYTDTRGVKHDITQHDVGEGKTYQYYYTRTWKGGTTYTKANKMEEQATALVSQIAAAATENGLEHRVAVVGFSCGDTYNGERFNYANTGVYNGSTMTTYSSEISSTYGSALKNARTQPDVIKASIIASANLATRKIPALHNLGLEMANGILTNNGDTARKKIVVVITGRTPGWTDVYDSTVANSAISAATKLKAQGATVYTINMMESEDNVTENFMKAISSEDCYTLAKTTGEFATATAKVIENIKAKSVLPLDAETQLVDTLSTYFKFADTPNVRYAWVENDGEPSFTSVPTGQYRIFDKTITLDGFKFNNNISTDATSKKLVVKFDIEPATGFLGGNGVPTNEATSAIKNDADTYLFPVPEVNVDIPALTVSGLTDKNIYLLGTLTESDMLGGVTVTGNGASIEWDQKDSNYGLASWQNEFVDISITARSDCDGKTDGNYSVTCTVEPKGDETAGKTDNKSAAINVFKPTLEYDDYTVYLGGSVPDFEPKSITWKHGDATSADTDVTMIGTAPTLSDYDYSKKTGFTACTSGVTLTGLEFDGTALTADQFKEVSANKFTVHVLKPTLSASDTIIYYSTATNLNNRVKIDKWECGHSKTEVDTGNLSAPNADYSFTEKSGEIDEDTDVRKFAPGSCAHVTVTAKVGGKSWTENSKDFWVHVVKPNFAYTDVTIYRGNTTNLESHVTYDEGAWTCDDRNDGHRPQTKNGNDKPDITYHFKKEYEDRKYISKHTQYSPTECTKLYFAPQIGSKTYDGDCFTVHVLQPVFTATPQDAWADYGTKVDLSANCVSSVLSWKDQTSYRDHTASTAATEGTAPVLTDSGTVLNYTFTPKDSSVTLTEKDGKTYYDVVKADKDFTITGLTYTLSNNLTGTVRADDAEQKALKLNKDNTDFTVHVNKFKLTIKREWDADDPICYRQDAIFTVNDGSKDFKVVIPKEENSVTIGGLFCGQNYTVTADSGWSWRYNTSSSTSETVSNTHKDADGNAIVYNNLPDDGCTETKSFTNTLNSKTLWLSGDWWCQNTCDGTKITQNKRKRTT